MVDVVQSVERQFVALYVAGSSPVIHPILKRQPNEALVAQWIEHQTSDLRVRGSSPFWRTIKKVSNIVAKFMFST